VSTSNEKEITMIRERACMKVIVDLAGIVIGISAVIVLGSLPDGTFADGTYPDTLCIETSQIDCPGCAQTSNAYKCTTAGAKRKHCEGDHDQPCTQVGLQCGDKNICEEPYTQIGTCSETRTYCSKNN
jgi:hypothetical protein